MILITGATGFIGRHLTRRLAREGWPVRCMLRPGRGASRLAGGVSVEVVTATVDDPPALRAAMLGVDTVIHLVGTKVERGDQTFEAINYRGTVNVLEAAQEAGVRRFIHLSYLGADRSSAYPFLRSKGQADEAVRSSGMAYTILRPSIVYGPGDDFTTHLAMLIKVTPFVFPVLGDGRSRLQPIHVEDLARCIEATLRDPTTVGQVIPLGGPQHLTYEEALTTIMRVIGSRRVRLHVRRPLMQRWVEITGRFFARPLVTLADLDLLAMDNITDLVSVPRHFKFEPRRFADSLDYLRGQPWRRLFWRLLRAG